MEKKKHNTKAGFGLLEVMISALLIAIMIIGGSAAMYHAGSNIRIQGNKRIAMQIANQRLEHARANYYYRIVPPEYFETDGDVYYLGADNANPALLDLRNSEYNETITLDGVDYILTTRILRRSTLFNPECIEVTASVLYRASSDNKVELTTVILPPQVSN